MKERRRVHLTPFSIKLMFLPIDMIFFASKGWSEDCRSLKKGNGVEIFVCFVTCLNTHPFLVNNLATWLDFEGSLRHRSAEFVRSPYASLLFLQRGPVTYFWETRPESCYILDLFYNFFNFCSSWYSSSVNNDCRGILLCSSVICTDTNYLFHFSAMTLSSLRHPFYFTYLFTIQ